MLFLFKIKLLRCKTWILTLIPPAHNKARKGSFYLRVQRSTLLILLHLTMGNMNDNTDHITSNKWHWIMNYCKINMMPVAQKWAWDKAEKEYNNIHKTS